MVAQSLSALKVGGGYLQNTGCWKYIRRLEKGNIPDHNSPLLLPLCLKWGLELGILGSVVALRLLPSLSGSTRTSSRTAAWVSRWWLVFSAGDSIESFPGKPGWILTQGEQMSSEHSGARRHWDRMVQTCRGATAERGGSSCILRIQEMWFFQMATILVVSEMGRNVLPTQRGKDVSIGKLVKIIWL